MQRNGAFAGSLQKFGFTKVLSEHYSFWGLIRHKVPNTTHYSKSSHYHHLHVGGLWGGKPQFKPNLYERHSPMSTITPIPATKVY